MTDAAGSRPVILINPRLKVLFFYDLKLNHFSKICMPKYLSILSILALPCKQHYCFFLFVNEHKLYLYCAINHLNCPFRVRILYCVDHGKNNSQMEFSTSWFLSHFQSLLFWSRRNFLVLNWDTEFLYVNSNVPSKDCLQFHSSLRKKAMRM